MPSQRLMTLSMARVRKGQSVQGHHTVCVAKEGNHVDVSLSLSPIREEDGRVIGASAIHRDISDRVHARREKEKLEAELNARPTGSRASASSPAASPTTSTTSSASS